MKELLYAMHQYLFTMNGFIYLCVCYSLLKYADGAAACKCGVTAKSRIINGIKMARNDHPWMAEIEIKAGRDYLLCGGSIITNKHILSAAHCFEDFDGPDKVEVMIGNHKNFEGGTWFDVADVIVHERYNDQTYRNDIAILELKKTIKFTQLRSPICVVIDKKEKFSGKKVTVMGWGTTKANADVDPDVIMQTTLTVMTNAMCNKLLKPHGDSVGVSNLCAHEHRTDSCQGDSGGPLVYYNPKTKRNEHIGIVSNGIGCATELPGVYTRTAHFARWIASKTRNGQYCNG